MKDDRVRFLIGVDGGGSKTLALVADAAALQAPSESRVLGRGLAGPSNYHAVGLAAASAALETAIAAAIEAAGEDPGSAAVGALCLGLAGLGRPEDCAVMRRWATERFAGAQVTIVNDAQLVLAAGTPQGWGIALISGTGSLIYGEDSTGRCARAGGWGYLLGDEGSGYAIGLAALRAIARAADGRGPQTALTAAVLEAWELARPQDLIAAVYQGSVGRAEIASLATLVDGIAGAGDRITCDPVAGEISAEAGRELALALKAVAQQLALEGAIPCALAGSVLVQGQSVRAALLTSADAMDLKLEPVTLVPEPALGALMLAQRCRAQMPKHMCSPQENDQQA